MLKVRIAKKKGKKGKKYWIVLSQYYTNKVPRVLLAVNIWGRFKTKKKAEVRRKAVMKELKRRGG